MPSSEAGEVTRSKSAGASSVGSCCDGSALESPYRSWTCRDSHPGERQDACSRIERRAAIGVQDQGRLSLLFRDIRGLARANDHRGDGDLVVRILGEEPFGGVLEETGRGQMG